MLVGGSRRWTRWQRPVIPISNFLSRRINAAHLSRNAIHFAEDGREEGALSTTNGSDDGGQATLLDGHVDAVDESVGLLRGLVGGSRSVVPLSPLERSVGDTDGIGVDWVGIRGDWDSLRSRQEGVDAAPGSSGDSASTKGQTENFVCEENCKGAYLRSWGRAIKGSTNMEKKAMAGKTRAAVISPWRSPNRDRAAMGTMVFTS